jgi:hypothetical protein
MQVKLGFNYRVHVSRMMPFPFRVARWVGGVAPVTSAPDVGTHSSSSSCVTVSAEVTAFTLLTLTRIGLSSHRVIAVTHY